MFDGSAVLESARRSGNARGEATVRPVRQIVERVHPVTRERSTALLPQTRGPPQLAPAKSAGFKFHYTPTHASWVNLIECFFSILSKQGLAHSVQRSKQGTQTCTHASGK